MESSSISSQFLHYGSLITIKTADNFYLYSKGFIDNNPILQDGLDSVSDLIGAVFRIIPQCMFSTQKEILRYISDSRGGVQSSKVSRLEEALDGEIKTNIHTYNNFKGEAIKYGSLIQLEHIQSHKFLTLNSQKSSEVERENLKLSLEDYGSEYSHFRIEPSFRYQKEGNGLVRLNDKVHFEIAIPELNRMAYLHSSKDTLILPPISRLMTGLSASGSEEQPNSLEINVSLDKKTRWAINLYAPFVKDSNQYLSCGDYIWLTRVEEQVCLCANFRQMGHQRLKMIFNENLSDTNGLWKIEAENQYQGGLVNIENRYRLKHISSGKYLTIKERKSAKLAKASVKTLEFHKLKLGKILHANNLWKFVPLETKPGKKFLESEELCKLVNANLDASFIGKEVLSSKNITKFAPRVTFNVDELTYIKLSRAGGAIVWETLFLLNCYPILCSFPEYVSRNSSLVEMDNKAVKEYEKYMILINKCINDLELFCNNKLQSMVGMDNQYGEVQKARQRMLKEQQFFEALAQILDYALQTENEKSRVEKLQWNNNMYVDYGSLNQELTDFFSPRVHDADPESMRIKCLALVITNTYRLISVICHKNYENQLYAFQFFKIFIKHVGLNVGATKCMLDILRENEKLLLEIHEAKNDNIIAHYTNLLKFYQHDKKPQLLDFLRTICVYKGDSIAVNQEKIFNYIFSSQETKDQVLISTSIINDEIYIIGEKGEDPVPLRSCFFEGKIIDYPGTIIYFIKLLELYANLCFGRNYMCTEYLKEQFSLKSLQIMIANENLSKQLRAALVKLSLSIYVDTYPREEFVKPELIKVLILRGGFSSGDELVRHNTRFLSEDMKTINLTPKSVQNIRKSKKSILRGLGKAAEKVLKFKAPGIVTPLAGEIDRFNEEDRLSKDFLQTVIRYFDHQAELASYDVLTYEILRVANKQLRFELFGTVCTDFVNEYVIRDPRSGAFRVKNMDLLRFLTSVSKIFLKQHPSVSERSKMYKKRASKLFAEDEEDSGKKTIKSTFLTGLLNDPTSLSDPIIRCAANLRNFLYLLRQSALQNPDQKNYENRIKIKICRMLHYYLDWRQEFLINNITQWFNTLEDTRNWKTEINIKNLLPKVMKISKSSNITPSLESMVAEIYNSDFNKYYNPKIPDLNAISEKPILYQLLKVFISSTDHLLQSLTVKLIIRCFKQREEFLLSVKRLYVISSEGDKLLLRWVKKSLTSFRQYSEQSELWLNYWKQNDYLKVKYWENFQSVMDFLVKLGNIFYEDTYIKDGEPSIGNKGTISKARQDMLYYLGAHNLIIRLLKDGMHTLADLYEAPNEHIQEPRLHIRELFTQCHKILRRFVYMHTRNQKRLHKHIHVFLQHLRIDVDQIPLICEIYKDNYSLLSQINKDILKRFKKVIYSEGRRPIYLEFLDVIQTSKGKALSQNQRYVINFFVKEEFNRFLLYMNNEPEPEFIFEAERPKNASWSYQDIPYEYHGKLLTVLSKCGFGVSGMYLNEAKCQKIFRLPSIFRLLEHAENKSNPFYRLKIPILDFLFNIYIDCEKTNDDVKESADFISYMKSQVEFVSKISSLDSSYVMFLQIWVKILTKYSNSHLNTREAYIETKEDFLAIKAYTQALFDNHKIFYSRKVPESLIQNISILCSKFGLEFPIIQYEEYHDIAMDPFDSLVLLRDDSKYELKDYSSEAIECWNQVKEELLYDDGIKEYLKLEQKALNIAIYRAEDLGEGLTFENIIESLINFIRSSRSQQDEIDTIVSAIELLASLIENPVCNPYDDAEEIKVKIQDQLNSFGVSRVVLALMCDPEVNKQVFHALLELSIQLLDGGNDKVQQEFYQYFIGVAGSEYFFEKIHNTLLENVSKLASGHISEITRVPVYKSKKVQMRRILRVLQLFCEGHFTKLQNYIRHQEKSRASYNIIDDIVSLLDMLLKKMYFKHFFEISQCFDTLTEAIQGPCKENQESIIDGKFLELAAYLLSLDENSGGVQVYEALKGDRDFIHLETIKSSQSAEQLETISGWMISHLKYKCMITLLSLLEGRNDNYVISRIIRAFNVEIFKENLISIYDGYTKLYKKVTYTDQIFSHHAKNDKYQFGFPDNPQDKNPEYFTVIIEVGFMIFHLMKSFHDNDDPENREVVEEELPELELEEDTNVFFAKKILGDLGKVGFALVKDTMNTVAKATDMLSLRDSRGPALEKSGILEAAYEFFGKYTGNIEVVFNGSLTKVYFSLPPEFVGLNKEIKENFHNNADRTSDQTKLRYLMMKADGIVEQIKNNHKMEMLFQKYPFVSVLTSNVTLWGELVFYLTLILNFFIIFSYAYYGDMTLYKPSLFYEETGSDVDGGLNSDDTKQAIEAIGIVLVVCTVFIVGVFLLKTGPVLAKRGWNKNAPTIEFWKSNPSKRKIALKRLKQSLWTLLYVWSNWNVIYYCLYFAIALCGVVVHPFYFSLLLLDMLYRYPALQNVIKSITMPKKALILTFIFMLVIVYIFGLVGFWKFSEYFNGNCPSLFYCFLNVWDKGFKANGGIGGYLKQWTDGSMNTGRLIYDNLYNIIIMIIMLNIVQGIIIDTFAILREAHERNTSDRENKCYICGMERDLIERVTSKPFRYHTLREHHEWNYILYIAYLRAKEETEYTGIESYVREQIDNKDFQWFPQHQALSVKEESNTEEKRLLDSALRMEEKLALMEEEIKKFKNIY
ncbi:unnamed protein product [Blepharisma stoltei]|uniref:MIR domain-containing protein n=1 Tax=Blepharisma stoltei TaxID=1481888 RepID=A0AAU9JAM1_9CILI|nr:unnamed protein product [Blepharisma stoltei]